MGALVFRSSAVGRVDTLPERGTRVQGDVKVGTLVFRSSAVGRVDSVMGRAQEICQAMDI